MFTYYKRPIGFSLEETAYIFANLLKMSEFRETKLQYLIKCIIWQN